MLKAVIEFNRKRNGFKYDPQLECDMFNEEVNEFFDATSVAKRIDAVVDAMYVMLGTKCKLAYNGFDAKILPYAHEEVIDMMMSVLQKELGENYMRVITEAQRIVCEINAEKISTLNSDGKVMKQKSLRDATKEIASIMSAIDEAIDEVDAVAEKAQ